MNTPSHRFPRQLPKLENQSVKVYRNLNQKCLSVQEKGLVIGHAQQVALENVSFLVSETGRQKVIASKRKNVHAFVKGTLTHAIDWSKTPEVGNSQIVGELPLLTVEEILELGAIAISYNPYKHGYFYRRDNEQPVTKASKVVITTKGVFAWEVKS